MSKQIKLKSLLKEGYAWERKPGKPLPTIQEVMDEFQAKAETEEVPVDSIEEAQNISIQLTKSELEGLMYAIQQSDIMDILSKTNQMNTPHAKGFISGKNKLEQKLKTLKVD
jgi:hypothetical protein